MKAFTHSSRHILLRCALLALTFCGSRASAATINWGSDVGDALYTSNGTLLDASYRFELGAFANGFVATADNTALWAANWRPFDDAYAPAASGWNPGAGYFASSATLNPDGTSSSGLSPYSFSVGQQAYIWAYNSKSIGSEWALVTNNSSDGIATNNWTFPSGNDQTTLPIDWRLSNASAVIYGGLNNVQGAGGYTSTPTNFQLQTHTTAPVPEPSSALLASLCVLGVIARRRRR